MAVATVIETVERSVFEANAPSSADIQQAMRQAVAEWPMAARYGLGWAGSPRVTREASPPYFVTHVAWVYRWRDDVPPSQVQHLAPILAATVADYLRSVSADFEPPTAVPFDPVVNGPLTFWTGGQASQTHTADTFPTGVGRIDATENPAGPTTAGTHPTSASEAGQAVVDGAVEVTNGLPWGWILAVVSAVGLVAIAPSINSMIQTANVRRQLSAAKRAR